MSLTSAQKEEVAVLLGWERIENGVIYPHWWHDDHRIHFGKWPVTLEAMFAKCRERKWRVRIFVGTDEFGNIGDVEVSIGAPYQYGQSPDPVAAFALALLAAHKEATND